MGPFKTCSLQKHCIREVPWRFREGAREVFSDHAKNTAFVKFREDSVKVPVKVFFYASLLVVWLNSSIVAESSDFQWEGSTKVGILSEIGQPK